jgi:DNA integrity scanning protein DisA with diadenylate cyclase activity
MTPVPNIGQSKLSEKFTEKPRRKHPDKSSACQSVEIAWQSRAKRQTGTMFAYP